MGLSPLLILTLHGPERVLVVSTEPPDDLSCLTTPGVGRPRHGAVARAVDQGHPDAHSESMRGSADSSTDLCAGVCICRTIFLTGASNKGGGWRRRGWRGWRRGGGGRRGWGLIWRTHTQAKQPTLGGKLKFYCPSSAKHLEEGGGGHSQSVSQLRMTLLMSPPAPSKHPNPLPLRRILHHCEWSEYQKKSREFPRHAACLALI